MLWNSSWIFFSISQYFNIYKSQHYPSKSKFSPSMGSSFTLDNSLIKTLAEVDRGSGIASDVFATAPVESWKGSGSARGQKYSRLKNRHSRDFCVENMFIEFLIKPSPVTNNNTESRTWLNGYNCTKGYHELFLGMILLYKFHRK